MVADKPLVESSLELYDKYMGLIRKWFDGEEHFQHVVKEAFVEFMNSEITRKEAKPGAAGTVEAKPTRFAEVLSSYIDAVMRKELKDIIDSNAELERLDNL